MNRPLLTLGVAALTAGLAVSGCTTQSNGSSSGGSGGGAKASIAMASDPTTLDPQKGTVAADFLMARMLYDSLVRRDDGGKVVAGLATSWKATATKAEFTLRSGLTCSDGKPLTATQVATSISRFADPATGAVSAAQVFGPANKVTATGDDAGRTVTVSLANPWSDLLMGLTLPQAGIVCGTALDNPDLLKKGAKGAGTGPYYVATATPGSNYALAARDGYGWAPTFAKMPAGKPPENVDMRVVQSEATMANELQTGGLDYAGITGADSARFAGKPDFTLTPSPIVRMMIVFNERSGHPGADPKVRKAIAQALDRKAFNQAVTRGSGVLLTSIADSKVPCVSTDESLLTTSDPAAAKGVLKGVKVKVVGTNAVAAGAGNEYVQATLKAAGASVQLRNIDSATWGTDVLGNKGDWDLTVLPNLNLTNLLTTPASQLAGAEPPKGRNFGGVNNPGFVKGMGKAMATTDEAVKCGAWADAQKALLSANDVVPLAAANVFYISAKRVSGISPDGLFQPDMLRIK
ncbi:ABC transporter substrate-binding protein [Actinomadura barringtoniae]|uniref:ABC transporter substrate-binding protein n=1 Tax=Actinomadura barringtoniae TaxID=1427535 RepID=A0A939T9A1_9ACTN|nr:ABC transporter substrate-binding protein [Actinomadura barringtoniae]MBO2454029.1 ABC transporter substrate-binding protein [Actinomadura barringtoniae]